ncbi:glycosyltransferase family 24 protein [Sesbania bispinosa]|nr:glycosyltransferase family 24 protein [Sesbania bispinosa]
MADEATTDGDVVVLQMKHDCEEARRSYTHDMGADLRAVDSHALLNGEVVAMGVRV